MTANSFAEDVQASLDAGMNAHLSKPIVIDEVIKTILRYVHNDQQDRTGEKPGIPEAMEKVTEV